MTERAPVASFEVGEWVGVKYHRWHQPGQITDVVALFDFDGKKPLYRIDFGRFTLHLTADEIWKSGPPEPGVTYGPPTAQRAGALGDDALGDEEG